MKSLFLLLMNKQGDELGRLSVADVQVVAAGNAGSATPVRPQLAGQMTALQERVQSALASEGMEVLLDSLDLQITLSRALLNAEDEEDVLVRLPVQSIPESAAASANIQSQDAPGTETATEPLADWSDLFDLMDPTLADARKEGQ